MDDGRGLLERRRVGPVPRAERPHGRPAVHVRAAAHGDADGRRPVYGGTEKFQNDPHWRDLILFYEYFHGDNGAGLGASHQTGWTGTVAILFLMAGERALRANAVAGLAE